MDLNLLLERNRLALMLQEKTASDEERRAYRQFARDCSVPTQASGSRNGSVTATGELKIKLPQSRQR